MRQIAKHKVINGLTEMEFLSARVTKRKQETTDAATFKLDVAGIDDFAYQSGQFIVVNVSIEGKSHKRSYSLSSFMDETEPSITIKRVPSGIVSNFFLNEVFEGTEIQITLPKGKLVIPDIHKKKHLVLIAAGSGITPVFSIIKDVLVNCIYNNIILLYSNRNKESIIFYEELSELEAKYPTYFTVKHYLSEPKEPLTPNMLSITDIEKTLKRNKKSDTLVMVCAPKGIVKMAKDAADNVGISEHLFMYESFTTEPLNLNEIDLPTLDAKVTLQISNKAHNADIEQQVTLLKGLLDSKVPIDHSCMSGDCGLCTCRIKSGEVVSLQGKRLINKKEGEEILPCISYANSEHITLLKH